VLLLRKLEVDVFLVDGRAHGASTLPSTSTRPEHETRSQLRASSRSYSIPLFLLSGQCGEARSHKALRLGTGLMSRLLIVIVCDLTVLKRGAAGILGILNH
jgi:hypothetical protein